MNSYSPRFILIRGNSKNCGVIWRQQLEGGIVEYGQLLIQAGIEQLSLSGACMIAGASQLYRPR
jgi:hypothetical protein